MQISLKVRGDAPRIVLQLEDSLILLRCRTGTIVWRGLVMPGHPGWNHAEVCGPAPRPGDSREVFTRLTGESLSKKKTLKTVLCDCPDLRQLQMVPPPC